MKQYLKYSLQTLPATILVFGFVYPQFVSADIAVKWNSFIGFESIEELLVAILQIFIVIAVPIIVLFIVYAGFLYVTARGNVQQIEQATKAFTYAVIGGVIVLGAVALSEVIKNVVEAFRNSP